MANRSQAGASLKETYDGYANAAALAGANGNEKLKFEMLGKAQHAAADEPTKSHSWTVWNEPTKDVVSIVKAAIHVFWDFMSGGKRGQQAVENIRKVADDVESREKTIRDQRADDEQRRREAELVR